MQYTNNKIKFDRFLSVVL